MFQENLAFTWKWWHHFQTFIIRITFFVLQRGKNRLALHPCYPSRTSLDEWTLLLWRGVESLSIQPKPLFLPIVPTVSDIGAHKLRCLEHITNNKNIFLPYVVAVGSSWNNIQQYFLVLTDNIRYTFSSIIPAFIALYKILWAFDLPYPKDSQPIWMFIQRALFDMKSKFDSQDTSMLELSNIVSTSHHSLCAKKVN